MVSSKGILKGNVVAKGFIAEQGSTFSGHCEINSGESAKQAQEDPGKNQKQG